MRLLRDAQERVSNVSQPDYSLIQLTFALAEWREGRMPSNWNEDFALTSAKETPDALPAISQ